MRGFFKTLVATSIAATVCSSAFADIKFLGKGATVTAKTINTANFSPQVNIGPGRVLPEPDHRFKRVYPAGTPNNLTVGGTFSANRLYSTQGSLFPGIFNTGMEPPDPDLAVSTTHIVEVVNSDVAFFTKAGAKTFQQSGQQFFASIAPEAFDFDPKVIYDQIAKRFVIVNLGLNQAATGGTSSLLVAVSDDADPSGVWKLFKIDAKTSSGGNEFWLDYPGIGYTKDMIAFTGNMFPMASGGFGGAQIICLDKATLYGGTATPFKFTITDDFTCQLAKTYDDTTNILYGMSWESFSSLRITGIKRSSATSFSVNQTIVPVPAWTPDQGFITGPGGVNVQSNDPRILVAASYKGRLVGSHSVAVSSTDGRPSARWYEFKTNNWPETATPPALFQAGQIVPPSGHGYTFPAVSLDARGSTAITFSKIGPTTPGQVMGSGRKQADPLGTMSNPIILDNSTTGTYTGFSSRWGDYFDLELDPADNRTFWAVGMGAGSGGKWQTFIKSFQVAPLDSELIQFGPLSVSILNGSFAGGSAANLKTADGTQLMVKSVPVNGLGQAAGYYLNYKITALPIASLRFFVKVSGPAGATASYFAKNRTTGAFDLIGSNGLSSGVPATKTIDIPTANISKYVSSTGDVQMIIRTVLPVRAGSMPGTFTFGTDQAAFGVEKAN